jgi:iron-sulfur cluster assembly protein
MGSQPDDRRSPPAVEHVLTDNDIERTMSTTVNSPRKTRTLPPLMTLTDGAAERLRSLYAKGDQGKLLRIGVKTKGCSGLSYDMTWTDEAGPGDEVVNDKGLTVLVDRKASLFLIGTVMDYEVKALASGFTFTNPNEKGRCGCGESFHI